MNWELLLQASGIVIGAIVSLYQISNLLPGSRSTLKADLEILKLLDPADPNYKPIKAHIDSSVRRIYPVSSQGDITPSKKFDWPLLIFFIIYTLGSALGTLYLTRSGSKGWAILTGVFALTGLLGILGVFVDEEKKSK